MMRFGRRTADKSIALAGTIGLGVFLLSSCNRAPYPQAELARLAPVATDDIAKDPALLQIAMTQGEGLYGAQCASCHGADLKGLPDRHASDLTDNEWLYGGDDLDTGGIVHKASDVEKTILLGIRSKPRVKNLPTQQENDAQNAPIKNLTEMPPMGPGLEYNLTEDEIADVTEYVLQLGGQAHDAEKAKRGQAVFEDKGSCYDCHGKEGTGDQALGSTNLTKPQLYLYGSSREAILASIKEGRAGASPAFEGKLKPEEVKAIAVYVFSKGGPGSL